MKQLGVCARKRCMMVRPGGTARLVAASIWRGYDAILRNTSSYRKFIGKDFKLQRRDCWKKFNHTSFEECKMCKLWWLQKKYKFTSNNTDRETWERLYIILTSGFVGDYQYIVTLENVTKDSKSHWTQRSIAGKDFKIIWPLPNS